MSELPYFRSQTATIFAPGGGADERFTLDFSLAALLPITSPGGGGGWGGGLGAVIVLEGFPRPVRTVTGVEIIAPGPTEQAVNGLSIVRLEEGGIALAKGALQPQAKQGAVIRGRRGTTGRSAGSAEFKGTPPTLPPAGGGTT